MNERMRKTYDKLVRDKIPAIIEADGYTCSVRTLSDDDYVQALKAKLIEEAQEVHLASGADDLTTEFADVLEVVISLCEATGISFSSIIEERQKRAQTRGRFVRRIFLEYVE